MELSNAIDLILKGVNQQGPSQRWADLGAGSGLFSRALSALLPEKSIIHAVDKTYKEEQKIKSENASTQIMLMKKDFTSLSLDISNLDGLLMANSLHFIKDKLTFLQQIKSILKPGGRIIIVEYDTDESNKWVPWPVSCRNLQEFLIKNNFGALQKLAEQPSAYQTGGIYSGLIIFEK